ncbi:hypothetical protein TELCIR_02713 [Teladorsagia circumcincta]|uniref:Uncharacterized protein n=1 Tax=Teladorsagia circumcincta TaxID=45464 RepID=A0A2G9UYA9_TELCI|nr:hypothetical protein TELCIR_02713 [Teladorsagia circumcincta]
MPAAGVNHAFDRFQQEFFDSLTNYHFNQSLRDGVNFNFDPLEEVISDAAVAVPQSELDLDAVKSILAEYKIHNADITLSYTKPKGQLPDYSAPIVLNAEKNTLLNMVLDPNQVYYPTRVNDNFSSMEMPITEN